MDANREMEDPGIHHKAYRFFPTKQEEKIGHNKKDGKRVYFYGQIEHDDFEKKKIAQFKQFHVKKFGKEFESDYFHDQKLLLFLSSYGYKNQATVDAMKAHEEFQRKYVFTPQMERVITYSNDDKVKMLVDRGFFYICGRDRHFRPNIVFNMTKIDFKEADVNLRAIVYVQEVVIEKMFIPGQVESWNIIYDLGGLGITDVPVTDLKNTLQLISANYGGRLYKLWMLNSPGTVYFSWKVVKNFLDPITVDKITIVKKHTDDSMWKQMDKSQIEKKYGGHQENKDKFYPFKVPPAVYKPERIISDDKYEEMYKSGFLSKNQICPEFQKKLKKETFQEEPKIESNPVLEKEQTQVKITKQVEEKQVQIKSVEGKGSENEEKISSQKVEGEKEVKEEKIEKEVKEEKVEKEQEKPQEKEEKAQEKEETKKIQKQSTEEKNE